MHINILIYSMLYCIAGIFAGAKFRRIAYYCFQGYIQDFCSGGGGGISQMTYFVRVCICAASAAMRILVNNYVNSGSKYMHHIYIIILLLLYYYGILGGESQCPPPLCMQPWQFVWFNFRTSIWRPYTHIDWSVISQFIFLWRPTYPQ